MARHTLTEEISYNGYKIVRCPENDWITDFKDGDDILGYSSFKIAYVHKDADTSNFRCITDDENSSYIERLMSKVKEMEDYHK